MAEYLRLDTGRTIDSAELRALLGRTGISDYVEWGLDFNPNWSDSVLNVAPGRAYLLDSHRDYPVEASGTIDVSFSSGTVSDVYAIWDEDAPEGERADVVAVAGSGDAPDYPSLLIGLVDDTDQTVTELNRSTPVASPLEDGDNDGILEIPNHQGIANDHAALVNVQSGQHHSRPIPGNALTESGNTWNVDESALPEGVSSHDELSGVSPSDHHPRPEPGNALTESGDTWNVDESAIDTGVTSHDDLTGVSSGDHHSRPEPGDNITESGDRWDVTFGDLFSQLESGDPDRPQRTGYQVDETSALVINAPGMRDRQRVPLHTTQEINLWVDYNNGNNDWRGSSDYPVRTLQQAFSRLPLFWLHPITIHVAAGTHEDDPGGVTLGPAIQGFFTSQRQGFKVVGEGTGRADTVINNLRQISVSVKALGPRSTMQIENMTLAATVANYNSVLGLENVIVNPTRSDGVALAGYSAGTTYCFNVRFGVNTDTVCKVKEGSEFILNNCSGQCNDGIVEGPEGTVRDYWDNTITHPANDGVWGNQVDAVMPVNIIHGLVEQG